MGVEQVELGGVVELEQVELVELDQVELADLVELDQVELADLVELDQVELADPADLDLVEQGQAVLVVRMMINSRMILEMVKNRRTRLPWMVKVWWSG